MRGRPVYISLLFSVTLLGLLASCSTGVQSARFAKPISFKISGSSTNARLYAGVIQNSLRQVGIPVEIDAVEPNTLFAELRGGQYQMTTSRWVGGNQDPIFLRDLFTTGGNFNRGRYSNPELDRILGQAVTTADRTKAKELYSQAQDTISREVPMLPLWYPNNMVVARRSVGNIKVAPGGDWDFIRNLIVEAKNDPFVTVLESNPETLDPLRGTDANSERLRQLMFNSLVRKDEHFDYVGDLATDIKTAADGLSVTFTLRDNVTFHDGRPLTSADAMYTLQTLLASDSRKAPPFFEGTGDTRQPYITSIDAPNPRTLVIHLRKPWLELLSNLVPIAIIPQGSFATQKEKPVGSGPFRFVRYDESQGVVDLAANDKYWEGAPQIKSLRVRVILDANTLQAEIKSGRIDLACNYTSLSPDTYQSLSRDPNLQVEQSPGANIIYLGFNAESEPLKDARVRRAIAYAIDRQGIVSKLLLGQARVAHSILPIESWAYAPGEQYSYDPEQAKKILDEAGYRAK